MSKEKLPKPKRRARIFLSALALSTSLGGCGSGEESQLFPEAPLPLSSPVKRESPTFSPFPPGEIVAPFPPLIPTLITKEETASPPTPTAASAPTEKTTPTPSETPALSPKTTETPTPAGNPKAEIIIDRLDVRGGPGTNYGVVNRLKRGTGIAVLDQAKDGWFKIAWEDKRGKHEGWINGEFAYAENEKTEEAPLLTAGVILPSSTATSGPTPTAEPTPVAASQEASAEEAEESKAPETAAEIRRPVYWGDRHRPEVALTFDDGFSAQAIQTTLEVLRDNNIKVTFFVIGSQLKAHPDLWRQAVADGHQICNHTYTHTYLSSLSSEEIKEELARWEAAAAEVLGEKYVRQMRQEFPYVRFPGGAGHNDERVLKAVAEAGYQPIAWSQETYAAVLKNHDLKNEAVAPIADEVRRHIVDTSQNGAVILLHFNAWDTLYLDEMVKSLIEKGLTPTSVSSVLD